MSNGITMGNTYGVYVVSKSITPAEVAAATVAEQTFTLTGVETGDTVLVNPPAIANATGVAGSRVTAADTVGIRFINPTANALTPTAGTYVFDIIRPTGNAAATTIGD